MYAVGTKSEGAKASRPRECMEPRTLPKIFPPIYMLATDGILSFSDFGV